MGLIVQGCCCCNLRTAGLTLGWLGLASIIMGFLDTVKKIVKEHPDVDSNTDDQRNRLIASLVVYAFDLLVSGLLLAGIYKKKHNMMLPWLILRAIGLIIAIPLGIFILFVSQISFDSGVAIAFAIFCCVVGLFAWIWVVIYSLYHEIRDENSSPTQMGVPHYRSQS